MIRRIVPPLSRHRLLSAVVLISLVLLGLAYGWRALREASALTTSYSEVVEHRETVAVDAYELLVGVRFFRSTARRLVAGLTTDQERLTALMVWTNENVRPADGAPKRSASDNFIDIVRRGYGYCDQVAHVFATLAHYAGYEAHLLFLRTPDGESPHTVTEVRVDGRWIVVDPFVPLLFTDVTGRLAGVADLGVGMALPAAYTRFDADAFRRGTTFETFPYQPLGRFGAKVGRRIAHGIVDMIPTEAPARLWSRVAGATSTLGARVGAFIGQAGTSIARAATVIARAGRPNRETATAPGAGVAGAAQGVPATGAGQVAAAAGAPPAATPVDSTPAVSPAAPAPVVAAPVAAPAPPPPPPPPQALPTPTGELRAEILLMDEARRAHLDGRYADAIVVYRALLARKMPADMAEAVRFFLGLSLLRSGAPDKAIEVFDSALAAAPHTEWMPSVRYYRAEARLREGDVDGAVADLRAAAIPAAALKLASFPHHEPPW